MVHKYEYKNSPAPVAVVGVRGYSGLDLARLLLKHPGAKLTACFATDAKFELSDYLPEAPTDENKVPVYAVADLLPMARDFDTVFLATPAEVSLELAPKLLDAGCKVIDLSGAFRLKGLTRSETLALYKEWYGFEHTAPELVAQAEYGLLPWAGPVTNKKARLIANPGCYATAVLMGVLPLLKSGLVEPASLVIDAKSGTSGAGRKAAENLLFNEVDGECLPYKVGAHQHFPEICGYVGNYAQTIIDPHFSTSLINVRRGIIAGIYGRLASGATESDVARAYAQAYGSYSLARVTALNSKNERTALSLKRVVGSARVHIGYKATGDKLYVHSSIDNLLKGAASQAVENFNRIQDYPVETALLQTEGVL